MEKVEYEVTGTFGDKDAGERTYAYILTNEAPGVVLFHPREKGLCASIEICELGVDGVYRTQKEFPFGEGAWINLDNKTLKKLNKLMS